MSAKTAEKSGVWLKLGYVDGEKLNKLRGEVVAKMNSYLYGPSEGSRKEYERALSDFDKKVKEFSSK